MPSSTLRVGISARPRRPEEDPERRDEWIREISMRPPRMTSRRTLVVIALFFGAIRAVIAEGSRREVYTERYHYHLQQMEGSGGPYTFFHESPKASQEHLIRSWIYHAVMSKKYEDALSIPFRYVEPDPPEP
jgi:hypothetical protein